MPLAALLALTVLAAQPAAEAPPPPPAPAAGPMASAGSDTGADAADDDGNDVPASAPKDDYRFVAWCYGALDEYLNIYQVVKPDLKAIDKLFGTPVVEAEPYTADIAEDRKALKRYGAAIEAAERASLRPISDQGAQAIRDGRDMWAAAKQQPTRRLADAWLFWGIPPRCDRVADRLKARATLLGQALAVDAPTVAPVDPAPAPAEPQAGAAPSAQKP